MVSFLKGRIFKGEAPVKICAGDFYDPEKIGF